MSAKVLEHFLWRWEDAPQDGVWGYRISPTMSLSQNLQCNNGASHKPVARPLCHGWQDCPRGITCYKICMAYFMFYAISIKWIVCVCREELKYLVCHKDQGRGQQKVLLNYKHKANIEKNAKTLPRSGKKLASCCPWVEFATPCHPHSDGSG